MKIKIFLLGLFVAIGSSCSSPNYLPTSKTIDVNVHGSFIKVFNRNGPNISGELIAIDTSEIVVLQAKTKKCVAVPISDVKKFKLRYAKPKKYWWTIPVYTFSTISHGFWLVISAPINIIVTTSVSANGNNAYRYSNKHITYEELQMFARFPQGIPENIDMDYIE
jgi:hypothetical protein